MKKAIVALARNAPDIAWSEYNHHWAGIFVMLIGLLALIEHFGWGRWAKHWPLIFLAMAAFLFFRADEQAWPLGQVGFFASLRDPEVAQHRIFTLLIILFGPDRRRRSAVPVRTASAIPDARGRKQAPCAHSWDRSDPLGPCIMT
jgi:hypothetical protein